MVSKLKTMKYIQCNKKRMKNIERNKKRMTIKKSLGGSSVSNNDELKIIHFLWLDFKNKSDGILDNKLEFFKDNIIKLHPTWKINFIQNWNQLIYDINAEKSQSWIIDVLNNHNIGAAHKSDIIRYFYLITQGGVWVDLSTFIISPFDELLKQNENGFTCYYAPFSIGLSWLFDSSSMLYDELPIKNFNNQVLKKQNSILKLKKQDFPYMPENYFIISSKKHPICINIFFKLKRFWMTHLDQITSMKICENKMNILIYNMLSQILTGIPNKLNRLYNNNEELHQILEGVRTKSTRSNSNNYYKKLFNNGYLFNYLQLYLAITQYMSYYKYTINVIENKKEVNQTIDNHSQYSSLCKNRGCNDIIIKFAMKDKIHLISASYNRFIKWSDSMDNRIKSLNSIVTEIIDTSETKEDLIEKCKLLNIDQIKFGSWSRDKSEIIGKLMKLFA